jgi:hypothetical protein
MKGEDDELTNISNLPDTFLGFEFLIKLAFLLFIPVICIFDLSDEGRDERETMGPCVVMWESQILM